MSNWCEATITYGDGDYGTPSSTNDTCDNVDGDGDGLLASQTLTIQMLMLISLFQDTDSTPGECRNTTTGYSTHWCQWKVDGDCDDTRSDVNPDAMVMTVTTTVTQSWMMQMFC